MASHLYKEGPAFLIAINTERTLIHFLSDVLVAVALLDLKVTNDLERDFVKHWLNSV